MDMYSALADQSRRDILEMLAQSGQLSATEISEQFKVTPAAVSQHLKVLREAKLIEMERKAQQRLYKINPATLGEIEEWLKKMKLMWEQSFDRLEKVLEREKKGFKWLKN